jgi:hypothetical protein
MAVYMQIYVTKRKPSWVDNGLRNILTGQYIDLEDMMNREDISTLTTQQAELWYTQAFSIVDFLLNSHSRDEFYRFCNELKAGTPVYQALYRAYGMPFNKISVLQNVWLHDLDKKVGKESTTIKNNKMNYDYEKDKHIEKPKTEIKPNKKNRDTTPKINQNKIQNQKEKESEVNNLYINSINDVRLPKGLVDISFDELKAE